MAAAAASWGPYRPYLAPPYDSEDGLTIVTGKWMLNNMPEPDRRDVRPGGTAGHRRGPGLRR